MLGLRIRRTKSFSASVFQSLFTTAAAVRRSIQAIKFRAFVGVRRCASHTDADWARGGAGIRIKNRVLSLVALCLQQAPTAAQNWLGSSEIGMAPLPFRFRSRATCALRMTSGWSMGRIERNQTLNVNSCSPGRQLVAQLMNVQCKTRLNGINNKGVC